MNLGSSKEWHGQPSSIQVADAVKSEKVGGLLIKVKIWISSRVIVRPSTFYCNVRNALSVLGWVP